MGLSSMFSHKAGLALCLVALAVAAPQQDLGGLKTASGGTAREITSDGIDREEVVAQVMAALTQQIETAVAQALASLQTKDAGAAAPSLSSGPSDSSGSSSGTVPSFGTVPFSDTSPALSSAAPGSQASVQKGASIQPTFQPASGTNSTPNGNAFGPTAKPVYNFEYKVAAEADQTYLSHSEQRDGDRLSGVYSYVNPDGALITVNYQAGPQGFSQTLDQQDGFIDFQQEQVSPLTSGPLSPSTNSTAKSDSRKMQYGSLPDPASKFPSPIVKMPSSSKPGIPNENNSGLDAGLKNKMPSSESSEPAIEPRVPLNQAALIAQVISSLQPEISAAVKAALDKTNRASPAASLVPSSSLAPSSALAPSPLLAPSSSLVPAPPFGPVSRGKTTKKAAPGSRLNSIAGSGRRKAVLSKESGTGIQNAAPVSSERSKGTTGDILNTFGNGLFVKIKTPHSEISY